ncbi:polysaccharide export protein [bacterium]|nr:MAG: polysaccharide export protein [bacterium]
MIKRLFIIAILGTLFISCASRDKIAYYQDIENLPSSEMTNYNPTLKEDDLLLILVSSPVPETTKDFNLTTYNATANVGLGGQNLDAAQGQVRHQTYLVDNKGFIQFPVIGSIKLGGLTREEALKVLTTSLKKYITDPIVNLRILNYKITVQGEVVRPGTFSVISERITLPEAISMAGDMTIYGKRDNVLVVREMGGKKTYNFVDMTKSEFINSPFYYLTQNDLVVVEPNKTRINASVVGPNISVIISSLSLLITVIALLIR